jgi:hypothetical protein
MTLPRLDHLLGRTFLQLIVVRILGHAKDLVEVFPHLCSLTGLLSLGLFTAYVLLLLVLVTYIVVTHAAVQSCLCQCQMVCT